ncbi:hypothetical protein L6R50_14470 [Myxococcota bacterium]|nr:hypothetical protein [Myxococcota bacterium]
MRGEVAWSLVRLAGVAGALTFAGCADPLDRMCAAKADYFEQCDQNATDGAWALVEGYGFYGYSGRDEFVTDCQDQAARHLEAMPDATERKRLKIAFEDEALKYEQSIARASCNAVP